ncbi:MAG: ribonuclease HI [Candidatus Taylorbacteria bacterium]|nr:ribonuclease HI [Candidatus Taylorbacteria bacterium]
MDKISKNVGKAEIIVFTDGASRRNPGPGGWGSVVVDGERVFELGGGEGNTTNNRMELTAVVHGLAETAEGSDVTIYTDSRYTIYGITKWIKSWKKNGWITKTKNEVLNRDLWEKIHDLAEKRTVKWEHVGGHVGVRGNERCDWIATEFADGNNPRLYRGPVKDYPVAGILNIDHDAIKAETKKSDSSRSRASAYSYVSMVNGVVQTHKTWAECEKRVKGTRGAKYKKALSSAEEATIMGEFKSS